MRPPSQCLQFVPEPALPQVPVPGAGAVAGRPPRGAFAGRLFHVVFTLPAAIAAIALQNKREVYNLLFRATAQTLRTIAADPKHMGAEIANYKACLGECPSRMPNRGCGDHAAAASVQ